VARSAHHGDPTFPAPARGTRVGETVAVKRSPLIRWPRPRRRRRRGV